ncbi:MAG: HEPN domain-containing protein [Candidatus Thorarchaeota archaeon]|nr:HEPN domain-containing protein [Candidatus Thorarchaeota archaeon]
MTLKMDRALDWLKQAEYDLRTAEELHRLEIHAWSCFVSQQAAEKALKAVLERVGQPTWGHDLIELMKIMSVALKVPKEVNAACYRLNLYYVATRYPDHSHQEPLLESSPMNRVRQRWLMPRR